MLEPDDPRQERDLHLALVALRKVRVGEGAAGLNGDAELGGVDEEHLAGDLTGGVAAGLEELRLLVRDLCRLPRRAALEDTGEVRLALAGVLLAPQAGGLLHHVGGHRTGNLDDTGEDGGTV